VAIWLLPKVSYDIKWIGRKNTTNVAQKETNIEYKSIQQDDKSHMTDVLLLVRIVNI
jgi:hypothetical protein